MWALTASLTAAAVGIAVLCMIGWRSHQGAYSARYHAPITVAGLYWHFIDVVWVFLFAIFYISGLHKT